MLLSTQTDQLATRFGIEKALEILKDAGFDAYDMSLFPLGKGTGYEFDEEDYIDRAKALRAHADKLGIVCNQAHAPFGSSTGDPEKDEAIFRSIVKAMEIAAILGAKIIIVHPKQHLEYSEFVEESKAMNYEFYQRLIPYCEKFGIKVATENMWRHMPERRRAAGAPRIIDSTCARPEEFCEYVDMHQSEWIVACLDIGHVPLVGGNLKNMIRALGPRLQALHVHDNEFQTDMHTIPYLSKINFDDVTTALAEIDYQGDFTFEADAFYYGFPDALLPDGAKFMEKIGRHLMVEIEEKKKTMGK